MLIYPQYWLNRMVFVCITITMCACTYKGEQPYISDEMVMISQSTDFTPQAGRPFNYPDRLEEGVAWIELLDKKVADEFVQNVMIHNRRVPLVANRAGSYAYPPQIGLASFYDESQMLATGETFDPKSMTAAHKSLPFGSLVRCIRLDTRDSVIVIINDRGPYIQGRVIDLSRAAARELEMLEDGVVRCMIEIIAYPLVEVMGPKGNG